MKNNMRMLFVLWLIVAGFSIISISCSLSSSKPVEMYLVDDISGYKLNNSIVGTSAFEDMKKSHIGKLNAPEDAVVGYYEEGLTIWISEYKNTKEAVKENDRMVAAIKSGGQKFGELKSLSIKSCRVYRLNVKNIYHYFWSIDEFIVYVIAGPLSDSYIKDELVPDINNWFQ